MTEVMTLDVVGNTVSRQRDRRLAFPLRALGTVLPPLLAISLFVGTVEITHAPERAHGIGHSLSQGIKWLKLHPALPDISFEQAPYVSLDEQEIYKDVAAAKTDNRPRPVIQDVIAVSISDLQAHGGRPTFGLPNPRLFTTSNNTQYVVGDSGLGAVTGRGLAYIDMKDVLLCTSIDGTPNVINQSGDLQVALHDTDVIVASCPTSVTVQTLNQNTLTLAPHLN